MIEVISKHGEVNVKTAEDPFTIMADVAMFLDWMDMHIGEEFQDTFRFLIHAWSAGHKESNA